MSPLEQLQPHDLWKHFADLNAVPRPSKHEEKAREFVMEFGRKLGLEVESDSAGNVLIRKTASPGREGRPAVALQSHLDMVHQKNSGTPFDFATQGIAMRVDGDWVRAQGTTLGADNGIGVAATMAVLGAKDLVHPPLEALFTVDEETGMTGASGLEPGWLKARTLLNLDTEDDDELTIGCAGGLDLLAQVQAPCEPLPSGYEVFTVVLEGLRGGHSGMDIHLGRANANKVMNRFLFLGAEKLGLRLASLDGGGLRNAIPRESRAVVAVRGDLRPLVEEQLRMYRAEYQTTDPDLNLRCSAGDGVTRVLEPEFQARLLRSIYAIPNGIHRMSPDVPGLVQTSNNLARVHVENGEAGVQCLCRSSVDTEKMDLATAVRSSLELLGAKVDLQGGYPGWTPRPESSIVQLMSGLYRELFGSEPHVKACHAGLECGILGQNYRDMEMISFGPNIRGAHSPDECVQISSVQRFWKYLTATLERL